MKNLWISFVAALCFLGIADVSSAQLMMDTTRVELEIAPSSSIVDSMSVYNTTDHEVNIRVYWQDFVYTPPFSGKKDFLPVGASDYSLGDWIRFSPQEFLLAPKESQKINYTIQVPANIHGGYYGVLFFEQIPKETEAKNKGVTIITRMGCLFYLESKDKIKKVFIDNIAGDIKSITGEIFNQGDVFVFPKGIYYILDAEGLVVNRGELEKIYLTPGNRAKFKIDISDDLARGNYTLVLTFDLMKGDSVVKEIDFQKSEFSEIQILQTRD